MGSASIAIYNILESLEGSPVLNNMCQQWRFLAKELGVPSPIVDKLRIDSMVEGVHPRWRVEQVLLEWRLRMGSEANIVVLVRVLEEKFKWVGLQEVLSRQKLSENQTWTGLPKQLRQELLLAPLRFLGFTKTLLSVTEKLEQDDAKLQSLYQQNLNGKTLFKFATTNTFELAVNNIPAENTFHIPRKIHCKNELTPNVFLENCDDYFFIFGGDPTALSMYLPTDRKISNFDSETKCIENRIIISTDRDCFNQMCRITNKAVHYINYEDGKYTWRKSRGTTDVLQRHSSHRIQTEEHFLRKQMNNHEGNLICIIGSTGSGKSTILGQLARMTRKTYLDRIVIYVRLSSLKPFFEFTNAINTEAVCKTIANILSTNDLGKAIMKELLQNNQTAVELFLDSNEELNWEPWVWTVLQHILQNMSQFRVIISADFEGNSEAIERAIGIPITTVLPLERLDQPKFLEKYWIHKQKVESNEKVSDFATRIVSSFDYHIFKLDVPSKLKLLAKIETNNLHRYIKGYKFASSPQAITSELHLFQRYIEDIILPQHKAQEVNIMCHQALEYLYPTLFQLMPNQETRRCSMVTEKFHFPDPLLAVYLCSRVLADALLNSNLDTNTAEKLLASLFKLDKHAVTGNLVLRHSILFRFLDSQMQGKFNTSQRLQQISDELMQILVEGGYRNLFCFLLPSHMSTTNQALSKPYFVEPWTSTYGFLYTAFHVAAESGNESLFQYLVSRSMPANLNYVAHVTLHNSHGNNESIILQKMEILKYLIKISDGGVLQEKSQKLPEPLLMPGVHIDLIKLLIEKGANLQSKTFSGYNLAHNVASYMAPDLFHHFVEKLFNTGADNLFQELNAAGETAIDIALGNMRVKPETIQLLLSSELVKLNRNTILLQAIKHGYCEEMLKVILSCNRWSPQSNIGTGNLHAAIEYQNKEALEYLLKIESPDRLNGEGKTPLHILFHESTMSKLDDSLFEEMLRLLQAYEANKKSVDRKGLEPLYYLLDV